MMRLCHNPPDDIREFCSLLDPDRFIDFLVGIGEIDKKRGEYRLDCRLQCKNAIAWVIRTLQDSSYLYQIEIGVSC